jgi:hypothetical protein
MSISRINKARPGRLRAFVRRASTPLQECIPFPECGRVANFSKATPS